MKVKLNVSLASSVMMPETCPRAAEYACGIGWRQP